MRKALSVVESERDLIRKELEASEQTVNDLKIKISESEQRASIEIDVRFCF